MRFNSGRRVAFLALLVCVPSVGLAEPPMTTSTSSAAPGEAPPRALGAEVSEDFEVDLSTRAEPEPLLVEAIEFVGANKTHPSVIRRRLAFREGELLDDQRIEVSRLRLLNTGFFASVEFSLKRGSRRGKVRLVIEVVERNTILLDEIFLGFSSVSPFLGGLGLAESNFLGRGITVGGGFVLGEAQRAAELRTFIPNLYNTPFQVSGSLIYLEGEELLDAEAPSLGTLNYRRRGGTLGLGFSVGAAQRVSLLYRLESILADSLPNGALSLRAPSLEPDSSVLSSLTASYELDTRDDAFLPSQGSRVSLAVELGTILLGSSYEFSKYTTEVQQAFPVFSSHRLILRLFGGLVQGATPFFNQFFIGDWAYFTLGREVFPRQLQLNFSKSNDYDDLLVTLGAEYDIPLYEGDSFLYRLVLYAGIDASASASLEERQQDPETRRFPLSFDLGLKLDTAIGNFTVSLAFLGNLAF